MKTLRVVLGDQLTHGLSSLRDLDRGRDVVLMAELHDETVYVRHHKQKIAFILAAMRHFADELRADGVAVDYIELDAAGNSGSFPGELSRAVARHRPGQVVLTEPGEYRVRRLFDDWAAAASVPLQMRADDRFLCPHEVFADWLGDRRSPTMEHFYRLMRRRTGYLMDGGKPAGGQWNFDAENRKRYPRGAEPPPRLVFPPDATTREALALTRARFADHFGDLDGFNWPVTREQAKAALAHFVEHALPGFGAYQDAMVQGAPFLHHALLSPCLNAGLLTAKEVCDAAQAAFLAGRVPLNAAEGFIRQVIGWREYVRGLYWRLMPAYAESNALDAQRDLPWFYWSGETDLNCLRQVIGETRAHAYAHHIQRLMVTGNFALLAGVAPRQIEAWYLAVYADAYEWVELPNVHGMAIWADGGVLGTKPYAASGAYIDRMSDYCSSCRYDVKQKTGEGACPFNYLYWNFLAENAPRLANNPRLAMPYRNLARMDEAQRRTIREDSLSFLARIGPEAGAGG